MVPPFFLRSIKLTHYKNYGFGSFDFSPFLNVLVGNNGVGKTNLLDAVWTNIGSPVNAVGPTASYSDTTASGSTRFYRVVSQ